MAKLDGQLSEKQNRRGDTELIVDTTDAPIGTYEFTIGYREGLFAGFSVFTESLVGVTLTVEGKNKEIAPVDITEDLYGKNVLELLADSPYITDVSLPIHELILKIDVTNASNTIQLALYAPQTSGGN